MTYADSIDAADVRGPCAWCAGNVPAGHYVQAGTSTVSVLCSEACLREKLRADAIARWATRGRWLKRLAVAVAFLALLIAPHAGPPSMRVVPDRRPKEKPPAASFGPEWPPAEASVIADLGRDAWLHPLSGPFRRMPMRDSRVFGAERGGDRPIECRKGHCGIDLGGEIWGEQVHAAHDGVVDRVQREANPHHGGHYVRIAHRDGTVFTQYFHLAAIPRRLDVGARVRAGDVIGLLGDTGVSESAAHLHFTVSVRPDKSGPELYVDPEPLIALWPLRVPVENGAIGVVDTVGKPGVPLGGAPAGATRRPRPPAPKAAQAKASKSARKHARGAAKADDGAGEDSAPAPSEDEATPEASGDAP